MDLAPVAVAAAMVFALAGTAKELMAGKVRSAVTFVAVFGIAVGVAFLLRGSDFAAGVDVGSRALADLNAASTVLFGFALASLSKVGYEVKRAVDNTDSAKEPKLL